MKTELIAKAINSAEKLLQVLRKIHADTDITEFSETEIHAITLITIKAHQIKDDLRDILIKANNHD